MPDFLVSAAFNGLMSGAIYVLVALGLTLIYGVLHIINFAHGSLLMLGMYATYFAWSALGVNPYYMMPVAAVGGFALGYVLYRGVIGRLSAGKDENILLLTLALSIIFENLALFFFASDTRTVSIPLADEMLVAGPLLISVPKLISFVAAMVICGILTLYITRSDMGKAIRAVAKERQGARVVGINVEQVYAVAYGLGIACLGAGAALLMTSFYVTPTVGHAFTLVAFTTVVLGGMGSFVGALVGGLILGVAESVSGAFLGEQLGQIAIPVIFILILMLKPTGLFRGAQ